MNIAAEQPHVVAIGGGTGLPITLRALKQTTSNVSAIVTVSDDGGASGKLREEMGILPPGDIRNCILALSNAEPTMEALFRHRFQEGSSLGGQCIGNLVIAAMSEMYHGLEEGIKRIGEVLNMTGQVIPVTDQAVDLCATFEDGTCVIGETKIVTAKQESGQQIKSITLVPETHKATQSAIYAIRRADVIFLGPGSLYTSVIPNLLVDGIVDELKKSKAPKIYISNLMTQPGESDGFTAFDHVNAIEAATGVRFLDACIANTKHVPGRILEKYQADSAEEIMLDKERFQEAGIRLIEEDILHISHLDFVRHSVGRMERVLGKIVREYTEGK